MAAGAYAAPTVARSQPLSQIAEIVLLLVMSILLLIPKWSLATQTRQGECVILLHGLGRTSGSMDTMAEALEDAGYAVANIGYPSRSKPIEVLAVEAIPEGLQQCSAVSARDMHFVTHSMGGILLRYYLSKHEIDGLGRAVMLSPPSQGSEVADSLKEWFVYKWYNGPAGQQLGTRPDGFVQQLGPVRFPVGVITGNAPTIFDSWAEDILPGPDDGKVSVEGAKLDGMQDFLVLPYSHTFIMSEQEVIGQTIFFLQHGRFRR